MNSSDYNFQELTFGYHCGKVVTHMAGFRIIRFGPKEITETQCREIFSKMTYQPYMGKQTFNVKVSSLWRTLAIMFIFTFRHTYL